MATVERIRIVDAPDNLLVIDDLKDEADGGTGPNALGWTGTEAPVGNALDLESPE